MELFACVLAHSGNLPQFADVIQAFVKKQSQINVAFTRLHFGSPCFVCVYTSFILAFYQSYGAVFVESSFFRFREFHSAQGVSMSPGSLSESFSSIFVAVTFVLLGFCISGTFGFVMRCVLHIYMSAFVFVFIGTFLLQCILGEVAPLHTSYIVRPCFVVRTAVCCSVFYSVM